ncbi:MAG: cytochrome c oxidase assembly protein [Alphaproteobacteria bacterium]
MKRLDKNQKLILKLTSFVGFMIAVSFTSVPLYDLFCKTTGFGGTPKRVEAMVPATSERYVTVTFDGNVDKALPWDFAPEVRSVRVRLGEENTIKYRATNRSDKTTVGTATFNVQPDSAGAYFNKLQCFCFTEQVLKPGETAEFPVQFFVDADMAKDVANNDVQNITLSYTFFLAKNQATPKNDQPLNN